MLYIVATPIGNLEDMTLRAIRTLKEADFVVAEDTRHSKILLSHYKIETRLISFHSHSSDGQIANIISLLKEGKKLALISDAGMPGISDPGFLLIKKSIELCIPLTVIPGPSALTNAVVSSGLPCHRFLYLGFLPLKKGRKKMLADLRDFAYTIVLYEAPHRLLRTLAELELNFGNRSVTVCREMTKMYEEVFRGTLAEAARYFEAKRPRGEFTLVISGAQAL